MYIYVYIYIYIYIYINIYIHIYIYIYIGVRGGLPRTAYFFPACVGAGLGADPVCVRPSVRASAPGRRDFCESAPMQRGAHIVVKKAFPCSAALKVLGASSASALSGVMFSNTINHAVFVVLHVWCSRALFSDCPCPAVPCLEVLFFLLGALVL